MTHPDVLDEKESLSKSLSGSVLFHAAVLSILVTSGYWTAGKVEQWGDPKALGGGAVGITPVNSIRMAPREGRINPVANDTESAVPSKPEKVQPERVKPPEPDAIAIKSKRQPKRQNDTAANRQKYSPDKERRPDQVYSSTGQAATTPLFSQAPGSGTVGSGSGVLGTRFGYYEQLLREKIARNWRSEEIGLQTAPPVVIGFEILRNGTARNIRVARSSGNFTLDQSALRAVTVSHPFPPLPAQYEHESVNVEFFFRLQK